MAVYVGGKEVGIVIIEKNNNLQKIIDKSIEHITYDDLSGLTRIGRYVFYVCNNLSTVAIPKEIIEIDYDAFNQSNNAITDIYYNGDINDWVSIDFASTSSNPMNWFKNVNVGTNYGKFYINEELVENVIIDKAIQIKSNSFVRYKRLNSIYIGSQVINIGERAFESCSPITSFTFSNSSKLETIGDYAFWYATIKEISIPSSVMSIGRGAFSYSDIETIYNFENTQITEISSSMFSNSKIKNISLPSIITNIGNSAFSYCYSLTSITIPASVTSIDNYAFQESSKLVTMRIESATPPTLANINAISSATTQIQVPMESVEAYKTATNWANFADIIVGYTE